MALRAEAIRLDRGGYDRSGRYWGAGKKLYRVTGFPHLGKGQEYVDKHVRADSSAEARRLVLIGGGFLPPKPRPKPPSRAVPRYHPHVSRKPEESRAEYLRYAKQHAKLARAVEKAANGRAKTHGASNPLVKEWRAEARRERALASEALKRAKRFRGVYSRDPSSHDKILARKIPARELGRAAELGGAIGYGRRSKSEYLPEMFADLKTFLERIQKQYGSKARAEAQAEAQMAVNGALRDPSRRGRGRR